MPGKAKRAAKPQPTATPAPAAAAADDDKTAPAAAAAAAADEKPDVKSAPASKADELQSSVEAAREAIARATAAPAASAAAVDDKKEVDADGFTRISDGCWKKILKEGSGPIVPVLNRVYVNLEARLNDSAGAVIYSFPDEEYDFMLGRAETAQGLEMAVAYMRTGERSIVKAVGPKSGFSATRRPKNVPADCTSLWFDVTICRFEKEKNLHEMTTREKLDFAISRRAIGKRLFEANKPASAFKQYDKALTVLSNVQANELTFDMEKEKNQINLLNLANCSACKMKSKEYADCITFCNRVLAVDANNIKCWYRRATAYTARQDWDDARRDLLKTRQLCVDALPTAVAPAVSAAGGGATAASSESLTPTVPTRTELEQTIASIDTKLVRVRAALAAVSKVEEAKYRGFLSGPRAGILYNDKPTTTTPDDSVSGWVVSLWSNLVWALTGGCCRRSAAANKQQ